MISACHERLWAPPRCAHGFLVSDTADFHYKCSDFYSPTDERVLYWKDKDVGIHWPMPIGIEPLVAPKDQAAPAFRDCEKYPAGKPLGYGFPG